MAGASIPNIIQDVCWKLNHNNAGCSESCGLHVHVDAKDYTWPDMYRLLRLWTIIEPLMYVIGSQSRYSNHYSRPVGPTYDAALSSEDTKGAVLHAALYDSDEYTADLEKVRAEQGRERAKGASKKGHGRYKSINILPWIAGRRTMAPDTTIEFRLHKGTHDAERIISWVYLLQDIVDWAHRCTDKDISDLPKSIIRALCAISPRSKTYIIRRVITWRKKTSSSPASSRYTAPFYGERYPRGVKLTQRNNGLTQAEA
jgi:hypothetical protein